MSDSRSGLSFLITGTGTGVGKTLVCGALACALRGAGRAARYFKPVESGVGGDMADDAREMARLLGGWDNVRRAAAYRLPLAPLAAAWIEGRTNHSIEELTAEFNQFANQSNDAVCLIEGAGGLAVPVGFDSETGAIFTYADLAAAWRLPVIIVADAGLGMINHTMLTVSHARQSGLKIAGIIINQYPRIFEPEYAGGKPDSSSEPPPCPVPLDRLARSPLSSEELRHALERVPEERQADAAFSNPAMLSALARERILGIVPRLGCGSPAEFAAQAAPYLSPALEWLLSPREL